MHQAISKLRWNSQRRLREGLVLLADSRVPGVFKFLWDDRQLHVTNQFHSFTEEIIDKKKPQKSLNFKKGKKDRKTSSSRVPSRSKRERFSLAETYQTFGPDAKKEKEKRLELKKSPWIRFDMRHRTLRYHLKLMGHEENVFCCLH